MSESSEPKVSAAAFSAGFAAIETEAYLSRLACIGAIEAAAPVIAAQVLRRLAPKMSCQEDRDRLYEAADGMDPEGKRL
jgi:hypothetical protein